MSYSYSGPLTYGDSQSITYNGYTHQAQNGTNPLPAVGGFVVGAAAGGYAGSKKVPYFNKKNNIKDSFAKSAHNKYMKKAAEEAERKAYTQRQEVINKIKRVRDVDTLNGLLNRNPLAKEALAPDLLNEVTEASLSDTKATVRKSLLAKQNESIQRIKNKIHLCWNPESKDFVKPEEMGETTFKAIKKAARELKVNTITKYSLITGVITALAAVVIQKIVNAKKNVSK